MQFQFVGPGMNGDSPSSLGEAPGAMAMSISLMSDMVRLSKMIATFAAVETHAPAELQGTAILMQASAGAYAKQHGLAIMACSVDLIRNPFEAGLRDMAMFSNVFLIRVQHLVCHRRREVQRAQKFLDQAQRAESDNRLRLESEEENNKAAVISRAEDLLKGLL